MSLVLGVAMIGVALWCGARFLLPALRVTGHGRDVEAWHLLMGAAMVAMLLTSPQHGLRTAGLLVFALGVGWSLVQLVRRRLRASYARLLVACAAMAAMLLPAAPAVAAGTSMTAHMSAHMSGHRSGHSHLMAVLPGAMVVLLLAGLAGVLAVSVARAVAARASYPVRADAVCEGLMAVAMGFMLLTAS